MQNKAGDWVFGKHYEPGDEGSYLNRPDKKGLAVGVKSLNSKLGKN